MGWFLEVPNNFPYQIKKRPIGSGKNKMKMTLDRLPTHCNGQGSLHGVVGFNHWLTSLSADSDAAFGRNLNSFRDFPYCLALT